jgi:hypothetical protein
MSASFPGRVLALAVACMLFLTSATAAGQFTVGLSGPVLGYVFDSSAGSVRPVLGILGSSTIGKPLDFGFTLTKAFTLDSRHIIAATKSHPNLLMIGLEGNSPSIAAVPGFPATPSEAAASPRGTSVVFYYPDLRGIWIVTGLPTPVAAPLFIDLSPSGPIKQIALSDDGKLIVYSIDKGGSEDLYAWTASSPSARFLMSAGSVGGLTIMENRDAIVADRVANQVFAIRDVAGAAVPQFLAGPREGVNEPVGVAVSSGRIYVANAAPANVIAMDTNGHVLNTYDCSCAVSGLFSFRDSVFRLTTGLDPAVWLFDASSEGRILFVPKPESSQ